MNNGVVHKWNNFNDSHIIEGNHYNVFYASVKNPETFPNETVLFTDICWAWSNGIGEKEAKNNGWWMSGPYNIGGYQCFTPEWWELYSSTIGRFVFEECYENYFAPCYNELEVPHTFVDIGLEYPVLLWQGTWAKKIHYILRSTQELLYIPRDCSYDDYIVLSSTYLHQQNVMKADGHDEYIGAFKTKDEIGTIEPLRRVFSREYASIMIDCMKSHEGTADDNARYKWTEKYGFEKRYWGSINEVTLSKKYESYSQMNYNENPFKKG